MKYEIAINDSVVTNDNLKDLWRAFFFFKKKKFLVQMAEEYQRRYWLRKSHCRGGF